MNIGQITIGVILYIFGKVAAAKIQYNSIVQEIEKYNRKDTVNMTPDEMNRFRHIAASAYYVSSGYEEIIIEVLGHIKEINDYIKKGGWTDSDFDKINNAIGRKIGKQFRYKNKKEMFDYIFKTEINFRRPVSKQIKF